MFWAEQTAVLERVVAGDRLREILADIVLMIERQASGMSCSILLVDDDGVTIRHGAAPTLPPEYSKHLDGQTIGLTAGSCGAAAYRKARVIVEDIATDPSWDAYRHLALPFGLRACWSSPIFSVEREVLGTFAMYHGEPHRPTDEEIGWVDAATHLAAIAIANDRAVRTAAALRRSEQRLRAVIEHAPDVAIQWYDNAGRLVFYNQASRRLFGWAGQGALGKTLLELGFWTSTEQQRFAESCARAAAGGHVAPAEFRFRRADGVDGSLLSTVFTIPLSDAENGFVCMDVDLTEHRKMEAAVRAGEVLRARIYDCVADVVFCLSVEPGDQYRFESVNHALLESMGLAEHEVVGRTVDDVIPAASLALAKTKYAEAIATRHKVVWEEVSRSPSGVRYGEVTVSPIFDAAGTCTLVGSVHDVTARREAELERLQIEAQKFQAQRLQALGTLAGGIAHDFNNILAAMHCNLDLSLEALGDHHDASEGLREVKQAAARASSMVRQILAFGRNSEPKLERIELEVVVAEALKLLTTTIKRTTKLRTTVVGEVPRIQGDSTQIHQVIMNLVTNAAHAIGDRGGAIEVRFDRCDVAPGARADAPQLAEGRYARITVRDDGPGIDAKTLQRIFEPFFTTKPVGEGTGLGLSVVHGIMKNHRGAVTVHSEVGTGTSFELLFPVCEQPPVAAPTTTPPATGQRVLFVDDDEAIVFLARRAFSRLGHRLAGFSSSVEALHEFERHPGEFDLVITDLAMPQLDGPALIRELRRIRPDLRIVVTSGHVRPQDVSIANALGVTEVLEKPQSLADLANLVARRA